MTAPLRERDMLDLLRARYTRIRRGTNADRYVRAEHVRYPCGWGAAVSIADFLVLDTYGDADLIGFEVKVSRSDWLAELRNPNKAWWKRHCRHWYVVTPDRRIVRDDLPDGWGHMTLAGSQLRAIVPAPELDPEPMGQKPLAQLGRAIAQTAAREVGAATMMGA